MKQYYIPTKIAKMKKTENNVFLMILTKWNAHILLVWFMVKSFGKAEHICLIIQPLHYKVYMQQKCIRKFIKRHTEEYLQKHHSQQPKHENNSIPIMVKQINKLYNNTVEYYTAMKMNKQLLHKTAWMNLVSIRLNERSQIFFKFTMQGPIM